MSNPYNALVNVLRFDDPIRMMLIGRQFYAAEPAIREALKKRVASWVGDREVVSYLMNQSKMSAEFRIRLATEERERFLVYVRYNYKKLSASDKKGLQPILRAAFNAWAEILYKLQLEQIENTL